MYPFFIPQIHVIYWLILCYQKINTYVCSSFLITFSKSKNMIIADLSACHRYFGLHPRMKEMLEYILQYDFSQQEAGRITLDGDDLFINLDEVELKRKEAQRLEFHKNYIDIQVPLLQDETMGWTALSDLGEPDIAYNPERDCGFYTQVAKEYFCVKPGQFTIFFPEDAHAPIIGEGKQRKLVGKIRV